MRLIMLLFGMGLLCLSSFPASVTAEEVTLEEISAEEVTPEEVTTEEISAEESSVVSSEPLLDRMARFFNTPDDVTHAGLLGKSYFQSLATEQEGDDPYLSTFDNLWHGYDTFVNLPIASPHTSYHLAADFFVGYANSSINNSEPDYVEDTFGGTYIYHYVRDLNARTQAFTAGVTVYSDRGGRFRPFVQVGAKFTHSQMVSTGGGLYFSRNGYVFDNAINNLEHTYNNHELRALLNAGFEYDINSVLAYRMSLMTETKGRFGDSLLTQDLILWPVNRFFLRFGAAIDLDAEQSITSVGGGFAF